MSGRFLVLVATSAMLAGSASALWAQGNGLQPAEPPPADFAGRQYVDSAGCVFLRSTVGGVVSWVPLFDAERRAVCNDPDEAVAESAPTEPAAVLPEPEAAADAGTVSDPEAPSDTAQSVETTPAPDPVPSPDPAPVPRAGGVTGKEPAARAAAPVRRTARLPQAAGYHPACPAHAPYGQPVRRHSGALAIRCVEERDLLIATSPARPEVVDEASLFNSPEEPMAPGSYRPRHEAWVQVGTFGVPANAARTRAALEARGLQVSTRQVRHGGRTLTEVRVGPLFDQVMAQEALIAAHALGLRDAFIRR